MTITVRDGGRLHVLTLWWDAGGRIEGEFSVEVLEQTTEEV